MDFFTYFADSGQAGGKKQMFAGREFSNLVEVFPISSNKLGAARHLVRKCMLQAA